MKRDWTKCDELNRKCIAAEENYRKAKLSGEKIDEARAIMKDAHDEYLKFANNNYR